MTIPPEFPQFRPFLLEDRDFIHDFLWRYQPQVSELTFTNLFIWRSHYGFQWSVCRDWLLILCNTPEDGFYALQPIGPPSRLEITLRLLHWLREEKGIRSPRIERADQRLASEIGGATDFCIEPTRDQFDYIYRSEDMIRLAGRKYHSKRNHINTFQRSYTYTYAPMSEEYLEACKNLQEKWCMLHRCDEDMNLLGEWEAICELLSHFSDLKVEGGVLLIGDKVEAFSLGEQINNQTAVIHIEKANPEIRGIYAMINQQFCENRWQNVSYINREQDLGEPGLRKAKQSYYPDHLIEKFRIRIKEKS